MAEEYSRDVICATEVVSVDVLRISRKELRGLNHRHHRGLAGLHVLSEKRKEELAVRPSSGCVSG